jgi:hypothetical protein
VLLLRTAGGGNKSIDDAPAHGTETDGRIAPLVIEVGTVLVVGHMSFAYAVTTS